MFSLLTPWGGAGGGFRNLPVACCLFMFFAGRIPARHGSGFLYFFAPDETP